MPPAQALAFGAVALFTERAQAADARFRLSDANAPAVIDVCRTAADGRLRAQLPVPAHHDATRPTATTLVAWHRSSGPSNQCVQRPIKIEPTAWRSATHTETVD